MHEHEEKFRHLKKLVGIFFCFVLVNFDSSSLMISKQDHHLDVDCLEVILRIDLVSLLVKFSVIILKS